MKLNHRRAMIRSRKIARFTVPPEMRGKTPLNPNSPYHRVVKHLDDGYGRGSGIIVYKGDGLDDVYRTSHVVDEQGQFDMFDVGE